MLKYIIFIFLYSCVPREGSVTFGPKTEGGLFPNPVISSITASGSQLIITGNFFLGITDLKITNIAGTWTKNFQLVSVTNTGLVAQSIDQTLLPVNTPLKLYFTNVYGTNPYNVQFPLTNNSVQTPMIQNNAVTGPKFFEVTRSKLNKNPGTTPTDGYILKWAAPTATSTGGFYIGEDEAISAASGLVAGLTLGEGIKGEGTTITTVGILELDIDTMGSASATKIPYFNSQNQMRIKDPGKILLENPTSNMTIGNEAGIFTIRANGTSIFSANSHSPNFEQLLVGSNEPCLEDGTNCLGAVSQITNIQTAPPLIGGGNSGTITISADWGTSSGQLVRLGGTATGTLPAVNGSNLLNVAHSIVPGTSISVTNVGNTATLNAIIGPGNAQSWQAYLNNLGTLNPNNNWVIIGNQDSFVVRGGADLQNALSLLPGRDIQAHSTPLDDIATLTYPPATNKFISGNGAIWTTKDIPICGSNYAVLGNGTTGFSCSTDASTIAGGTLISNYQEGIKVSSAGTMRFFANNNTNYVELKSPNSPNGTVWSLPTSDGSSGQLLATNGAGVLSFVTNYSGDLFGAATSQANYPPLFADNTGKNLSAQTVLIVSGTNVGINNSTPGNNLVVASGANGEGIESGVSFLGTCRGNTNSCLTHTNFKASTTGYALSQDNTGNTLVNAPTAKTIKFRINNADAVTITSAGKLGVGTTTPGKTLQVSGAGGSNGGILGNAYIGETATHGNTWASYMYSGLGDNSYALLQDNVGVTLLNTASTQYIGFRINNADKWRMTSAGNLGIATTAPSEKLTINGGNIQLENQTVPEVKLVSSVADGANIGEIQFLENTNQDGWKIRHNGNTDSNPPNNGTDDPLEWYRLTGGADVLNFLMAENGELWARITNIGNLSDITLKQNIQNLKEDPQNIINQFRPVNFFWNDQANGPHIGFIAQEVEMIDPRFVEINPIRDKLMINYKEIFPVMIANLKTLNLKTSELEEISRDNLLDTLDSLSKKQQELLAKLKKLP